MSGDAQARPAGPVVFTVGHSNVGLDQFLGLLRQHSVGVLVDVRSEPYSKYVPHFNGQALKPAVTAVGIKYLYLGDVLGGRPREPQYYDADGHVRYDLLAASPDFIEGIDRLLRGIREHRVALMCNEEDPAECHRRLLVGRVLAEHGVTVMHIRGDGRLQPEAELAADERKRSPEPLQQDFAFMAKEEPEWKSTRSVSRAGQQKPSSAR